MCFSATASFTAGAVIGSIGVATQLKVREASQRVFATIPMIFGIQQIAEGLVWVSLQHPGHTLMLDIGAFVFLLAADIIWPVLVPASCLLMEKNPVRRRIMKVMLILGSLLSLYYAFCLFTYKVTPEILNCHINYADQFPKVLVIPAFLLYLVATITPLMISGLKGMRWLGSLLFTGVLLSVIFYIENVTSVWCFFGALISGMIYWVLHINRPGSQIPA